MSFGKILWRIRSKIFHDVAKIFHPGIVAGPVVGGGDGSRRRDPGQAAGSRPRGQGLPTLLLRDLLAAHRQGHITLRPVAALLGMSTNDLRAQLTKTEGE